MTVSYSFQALRSFEKGVHLDPTNTELWQEDLEWARELVEQKNAADTKASQSWRQTIVVWLKVVVEENSDLLLGEKIHRMNFAEETI